VDDLKLQTDGWSIVVSYHPPREPPDLDGRFARVLKLDPDPRARPSSRHSVEVVDANGASTTCLVTAVGGASRVHEHSALLDGHRLIMAVGPYICALSLPKLALEWSTAVDDATCFGVYYSAKHDCFVSHGELSVARVSLGGAVVWSAGGKDSFSESFTLYDDYAEAIDFNHEKYRIDLASGDCVILQ
jgi:hypothetical protein